MKSKRLSHDFLVHFVDNTNHASLSTMEFEKSHSNDKNVTNNKIEL